MASRKISVAVYAKRKDGSLRVRKGRYITTQKLSPVIARNGAWAITPALYGNEFSRTDCIVTHIGTGRRATSGLSQATARKVFDALCALPNQDQWRRLSHPRYMTAEMKATGMAAVRQATGQ